jgi:hypothetical protein
MILCLESFLDANTGPSNIWVGCPGPNSQASSTWGTRPQTGWGTAASQPTGNDNNKRTLPPWLHDLFTQQIGELKQHFTHALLKPSSIREKYLSALMKHNPTSNNCPTCMAVHVHKGEGYCADLEQKLTDARNQASAAFKLQGFLCV